MSRKCLTWIWKRKLKSGEYIYDLYDDKLIPLTDEIKKSLYNDVDYDDDYDPQYFTFKNFFEDDILNYKVFAKTYTTEQGEIVHAFGYYGYEY